VLHIVKNVVVVAETFDDDYMDSALDVVVASHHPMPYSAHVVPSVKMARRMMMKSPAVVVAVEDP
jgi:hypothetical protein